MRATVQRVSRRDVLIFVTVAGLGVISLPVRAIPGAYAGVWRAGRLVRLLDAAEGLDACGTPALAVLHRHLDERYRSGAERVIGQGPKRRAAG